MPPVHKVCDYIEPAVFMMVIGGFILLIPLRKLIITMKFKVITLLIVFVKSQDIIFMSQETKRYLAFYSYRKTRTYMYIHVNALPYICMYMYTDMDLLIGLNTCAWG